MSLLQKTIALSRMLLCIGAATSSYAPPASASPCYVFDLPAVVSPLEAHETWAPLLEALSRRAGVCLRPNALPDLAIAEERLTAGVPDFAVTIPTALLRVHPHSPYAPLLTSGRRIRTMLVVRRDSPLTDLGAMQQAAEVSLGVSSGAGTMLSLMPQQVLKRAGVRCRLSEFSGLANVLREVVVGHVEVGVTTDSLLLLGRPELARVLRPVWVSEPFLPPPLVVHPRVPVPVGEAVQSALADMRRDAVGRDLLRRVRFSEPRPVTLEEYRRESTRLRTNDPVCATGP